MKVIKIKYYSMHSIIHFNKKMINNAVIITVDNTIFFIKKNVCDRYKYAACIYTNGTKMWCKNNYLHNEKRPAIIKQIVNKEWWFKGNCYGFNNDFTIKSWKEKVKEIKYLKSLEIFK